MQRLTTIDEVRRVVAEHRLDGRRIGLVPTMGFLHEGHLSLVREARRHCDVVVVSIFVNPTQFSAGEDLESYPRDLEGDEERLRGLGGDAPAFTFVPTVGEMYPRPGRTTVSVEGITQRLCGASRPGHFDGVATVVTKLHNIVQPDVAVYGRKDYQQLQVIRRMVADLDQPVEVIGGPIVRESDGLAMSSRNIYLDEQDRTAARVLSQSLRRAIEAAEAMRAEGHRPYPKMIQNVVEDTIASEPRARLDYVEVLDPETLAPPNGERGQDAGGSGTQGTTAIGDPRLLVAVAAHVGPARLIDNVELGDERDERLLLAATEDVASG